MDTHMARTEAWWHGGARVGKRGRVTLSARVPWLTSRLHVPGVTCTAAPTWRVFRAPFPVTRCCATAVSGHGTGSGCRTRCEGGTLFRLWTPPGGSEDCRVQTGSPPRGGACTEAAVDAAVVRTPVPPQDNTKHPAPTDDGGLQNETLGGDTGTGAWSRGGTMDTVSGGAQLLGGRQGRVGRSVSQSVASMQQSLLALPRVG